MKLFVSHKSQYAIHIRHKNDGKRYGGYSWVTLETR